MIPDELPPRVPPIHAATLTGPVDLVAPDPATITRAALAHGLASVNRFAGATQLPISVAQHSLLVRGIFLALNPHFAGQAIHPLLHDAHEYLIGDIIGPAEKLLTHHLPGAARVIGNIKLALDAAIRRSLCLPEPSIEIRAAVYEADLLAADLEWRVWMPAENGPSPWAELARRRPHPYRVIRPVPPAEAADRFREQLEADLAGRAWEAAA